MKRDYLAISSRSPRITQVEAPQISRIAGTPRPPAGGACGRSVGAVMLARKTV